MRVSSVVMANRTLPIMSARSGRSIAIPFAKSNSGTAGKSSRGRPTIRKRAFWQVMTTQLPSSPLTRTSASGSSRTMSNNRRADSVTDPGLATAASQEVLMPTSRSVASSSSCPLVALIRMFDRIGMVLFFSTIPCIACSSLSRFSLVMTKSIDPPAVKIGSSLREKGL